MRETDVTLFISPLNQGDPLQIINETGMVISGMLNPPSTTYGGGPGVVKHREINNGDNVQESEGGSNKQAQRNKRAPRQLWGEEEVARLKSSFRKYQGDWEAIIKEFEPDRTRYVMSEIASGRETYRSNIYVKLIYWSWLSHIISTYSLRYLIPSIFNVRFCLSK